MADIFVLGAGGWAISMSVTQAKNGHNVTIWSAFENEINLLKEKRCNANLLPGIYLPESVEISGNTEDAAKAMGADEWAYSPQKTVNICQAWAK